MSEVFELAVGWVSVGLVSLLCWNGYLGFSLRILFLLSFSHEAAIKFGNLEASGE